ncbi:hypothetical protein [Streptomyces sp. H39-S7]|uniref:hypothetical protein n=1 Tax=Streptomyces sp. H39-S7 TaxID=3004357 RepID=UPI0022AE5B0C|nr:hypothetical protein [Streptomyces sp. H39-S7]MCZ4124129.1 hypothetical protein [Streptomyces sp. H39-S7]
MIVSFHVRPQAAAEFGHRSRGGPVTAFAASLHAHLFGLPADTDPLPAALDALLQHTGTATSPEQQTAILQQVAEQLRNAAEILRDYQYTAQWERLPHEVAEQLRQARAQAQQVAQTLDQVAPAFSGRPTGAVPGPQPRASAVVPVTTSTLAAGHRR